MQRRQYMAWSIEGTTQYLSEFGLKAALSRIGTPKGKVYLSNICQVDPNNINNSNQYAYYIYCQDKQAKALLVTTSIDDMKYLSQAEAKFIKLIKSLVKQTTNGKLSKTFSLENGNFEQIDDVVIQIERDSEDHKGSLRGIISMKSDSLDAKRWLSIIRDVAV